MKGPGPLKGFCTFYLLRSENHEFAYVFNRSVLRVTGPLGMSLGVLESRDIEFTDIVDKKYNLFLDNTSMADLLLTKIQIFINT